MRVSSACSRGGPGLDPSEVGGVKRLLGVDPGLVDGMRGLHRLDRVREDSICEDANDARAFSFR
jgi:hypothetical protein